MANELIQKGQPGYMSVEQAKLRKASTATPTVTQAPATSMPVSKESAARGVVAYGPGGAAIYGNQGALQAGTTTNANGSQSFSGTTGQRNMSYATTLSNTNKIDQVPKDINALQSLAQKGQVSDGETIYNADGSQARNNNLQAQTGASVQSQAEDDYFNSGSYKMYQMALENLDANTANLIANAQRQSEQLRKDTNEVSRIQSKALNNALLMGGATGSGSSARYAPVSSEGILAAQEGYRVKQIMAIDQQEQAAIAAAQEAQRTGKYELLSQQVAQIEKLREEKVKAATELNKTLAEQANKLREKEEVAMKDNAIAELYTAGTTNVSDIMKQLRENGVNMSAKEVKSALDNIVPSGLQDIVDNAIERGASPDLVSKAMASGDFNKAYSILGSYASKAPTGIAAEYEYYKNGELQAGRVPVDFNTYQDRDANRKKSIAKAGISGGGSAGSGSYSPSGGSGANAVTDSLFNIVRVNSNSATLPILESSYKNAKTTGEKLDVIAVAAKIPAAQKQDITAVKNAMNNVDRAISELDKGAKTGLINSKAQYAANFFGKDYDPALQKVGSYLTAAIQPYRNEVTGAAWGGQEDGEYQNLFGSTKYSPTELKARLSTLKEILAGKAANTISTNIAPAGDYSQMFSQTFSNLPNPTQSTGAQLSKEADIAEKQVNDFYSKASPKTQAIVDGLVKSGKDDIKIVEYLKIKGYLK